MHLFVNSHYLCLIIYTVFSKIPYDVWDYRHYARPSECILETYEESGLPGFVHYQKPQKPDKENWEVDNLYM